MQDHAKQRWLFYSVASPVHGQDRRHPSTIPRVSCTDIFIPMICVFDICRAAVSYESHGIFAPEFCASNEIVVQELFRISLRGRNTKKEIKMARWSGRSTISMYTFYLQPRNLQCAIENLQQKALGVPLPTQASWDGAPVAAHHNTAQIPYGFEA